MHHIMKNWSLWKFSNRNISNYKIIVLYFIIINVSSAQVMILKEKNLSIEKKKRKNLKYVFWIVCMCRWLSFFAVNDEGFSQTSNYLFSTYQGLVKHQKNLFFRLSKLSFKFNLLLIFNEDKKTESICKCQK